MYVCMYVYVLMHAYVFRLCLYVSFDTGNRHDTQTYIFIPDVKDRQLLFIIDNYIAVRNAVRNICYA